MLSVKRNLQLAAALVRQWRRDPPLRININVLMPRYAGLVHRHLPRCPGYPLSKEPFMAMSREMRRLHAKWESNQGWPKRLEWIELDGIRGWSGQKS